MDPATLAIILALVGGPVGAAYASRFLGAKTSPLQRLDQLENDFRLLQDYTHELRQHIAAGKGAPPPPWPEGLTQ